MIRVKIDVTKIDKTKLFKGAKGTYLDLTLFETPDSKYGDDYRVVQDLGKDARARGEKGAILGNGKIIGGIGSHPKPEQFRQQQPPASTPAARQQPAQAENMDEDVPF